MQKILYFAGCALSLGFGLNAAWADVVTVNLTGHVTAVNDPSSPITVGESVTASYSYDTSTPLQTYALCTPSAPPLSMSLSVGGLTVAIQNNNNCMDLIMPYSGSGFSQFSYDMFTPGQVGPAISLRFWDLSGHWPAAFGVLPSDAPPLLKGEIGFAPPHAANYTFFNVQLDSAILVP